jgi:hypothetical protein
VRCHARRIWFGIRGLILFAPGACFMFDQAIKYYRDGFPALDSRPNILASAAGATHIRS